MFRRDAETRKAALASVAGRLGLRRVDLVRRGPDGATVTGVTHRYPHTFRVSKALGDELAAAGAPCVVDREEQR